MKPKNKRMSSGLQKPNKRNIDLRGKWKTVELDPSLFSEEGLEGLVCFEELTDYRMIDSKKAAAKAVKEEKKENKDKKKGKKRKASEEDGEKGGIESKEGEGTAEPVKKKAKKKKKKNKKVAEKESVQSDNTSTEEVLQENKAANGEGGQDEEAKDSVTVPDHKVSKREKKNKKKKKSKQQLKNDAATEEQPNEESPLDHPPLEKDESSQDKAAKPPKKQAKNWTNAALCSSDDKEADVSAWKDLFVPSPVLKALSKLGFSSPTPIQVLTLPPAIRDRMDILGAAETGKIKGFSLFLSRDRFNQVKLMCVCCNYRER